MLFQQRQEQLLHYDIYELQRIFIKIEDCKLYRKMTGKTFVTVMEQVYKYMNNCNDEYEILNWQYQPIAKRVQNNKRNVCFSLFT